ncbi:DUF2306 domain-containing protein [Haloarcula litorea]|uniref:DUF2306 domain-containing protein n=1 Tax=Haloarcula litorea TaxID=3032579 RepID=UPI0023E8F56C|nr:DUF2306 domain-containing protein [Halomicroarcula sp. GDY20]
MSPLEAPLLDLHVLAGFVALLAGLVAFGTEKGGPRHRRAGRTFVYAMAVVSATAVALFALDPTGLRRFLALVAVFSFYFAFSGARTLSRKRPDDDPTTTDWVAVGLFGLASAGLLVQAGLWFLRGTDFAVVMLVFGGLGTVFALGDVRRFRSEREPGAWLGDHVVRMGAGYIATVSAVSAVNFLFLPAALRWLWPTLLGTPLLVVLQRRYERRFGLG